MGWKPKKERALTLDEALDAARKELAPLWHNSTPMLAPVHHAGPDGGRYTAHPLDDHFADKSWLMLSFDPYSFSGEAAFSLIREWRRRYEDNDIHFMVIFRPLHPGLFTPKVIQQTILAQKINYPLMMDLQHEAVGALSACFGMNQVPGVALFADKKLQFSLQGPHWFDGMEKELQTYIRAKDPGCPFFPVLDLSAGVRSDLARIDFGARFGNIDVKASQFKISGQWTREAERLVTQDPASRITLKCPGPRLSAIFQALQAEKIPRVVVEVNGHPPTEKIASPAFQSDEDGSSFLRFDNVGVYPLLSQLPPDAREITLKFPNADRCPVGLYALLFGN